MTTNNSNSTNSLLKFLTFALLAGCATAITYAMLTRDVP